MELYFLYAFIQAVIMTVIFGRDAIKWNWTSPGLYFLGVLLFAPIASMAGAMYLSQKGRN